MDGRITRITLIGMGALGVLYGEHFAKALGKEHVRFLADAGRIAGYQRDGIFCNGVECHFTYQDTAQPGETAELLIFAVKATALQTAIEEARSFVDNNTIILSVLNGVSSEEIIEEGLGAGTVLYSIAQGMDAVKAGNRVTYSRIGTVCIGVPKAQKEKLPMLERVAELFGRTGLPYVIEEDIMHRLWGKWMLNVGVNQTVMVKEGNYGTVQKPGEARDLMIAAMHEAMAVAQKEMVSVTEQDLKEYLDLIDTLSPEGMPSMRQDGLARRYSEVELFAGTVLQKANKYGIAVPVNRYLYDTVKQIEESYKP